MKTAIAILSVLFVGICVTFTTPDSVSSSSKQFIVIVPEPSQPEKLINEASQRAQSRVPPKIEYEPILGVTKEMLREYERQRQTQKQAHQLEIEIRKRVSDRINGYQSLHDQAVRKYEELLVDPIKDYRQMESELRMLFNGPNH
jgi:hypothetical protein